jgi:hypothetical protein
VTLFLLGGGIGTKVGTCSYYETFKLEWSSYYYIWAATLMQRTVEEGGGEMRHLHYRKHILVCFFAGFVMTLI